MLLNPMSDINAPQTKYDVFVSFSGEDIRLNFLSHLVDAFKRKKLELFVDDGLERGEKIWPSLAKAIEESSISLIIFSENYATSSWCLNELVHILECREKYKRIAIPVFYYVDPTEVWQQTGSYETAFDEHEKEYNSTVVQSWRDALKESANLSGITSLECGNDAELIVKIASQVLRKLRLNKNSVNSNGLIGIDKKIARVESLLNKESEDTRFIGIWGIGGIGKTTIAEEIFNKLHSVYHGGCFLRRVREESAKHGEVFLKEKLFSTLLDEEVKLNTSKGLPDHVKRRVERKRVLIVLDDVNDSNQLQILVGHGDWFRSGSTVIITTRNKQVVPAEDDYIYEVAKLDFDEALELFNLNAFKQSPLKTEEYCELSKKVVKYAKGTPLVLIVLARLLRGKRKEIWGSLLNKLEKMPLEEVYESLKLSYEDLDRKERKIFLDLACFLVGLNLKVERIKSLLKEGENDNAVTDGLERLKDRALITFSEDDGEDDGVSMHDIIQEMAWEIVFHECPEDPGRRSRLGDPDDIYQVLQNDKGSEAIKSLKMPLTVVSKLNLSPHIFAKMSKLQFLHVPGKCYVQELLPQGLQSLPTELRYLVWWYYPLKSLPENFSAEKLVILKLSDSKVEKLWQGVQNLVNLKEVDLRSSDFLKELPDFSKATNLELLDTYNCKQLTNVHPSIFFLEKLDKLDLSYCGPLSGLPTEIHLRSLSFLNLQLSEITIDFSVKISENMIKLNLAYTRVIALPSCFNNFTKLTFLNISGCKELMSLPELPSSLEIIRAEDCTALKTISFPSIVEQLEENKERVEFWNCLKLDEPSRVAIGSNAEINMMNFACKHLLAHDDSFGNFQAKYVYPGSSVPEWFENKTTEDYIVIELSAPNSPILGFIFCYVLRKFTHPIFKVNISICDDEGEGKGDTVETHCSESNIDHVCVMYDQRFSRFLSRARNLRRLKIKVSIEDIHSLYPRVEMGIRGFGVYPINTTSYHDFIQKMELLDLTLQSI